MTHAPTPGPWYYEEDEFYGVWSGDEQIAEVWFEQDAQFIVRACNNHDGLLEVAKLAKIYVEHFHPKSTLIGNLDRAIARAERRT